MLPLTVNPNPAIQVEESASADIKPLGQAHVRAIVGSGYAVPFTGTGWVSGPGGSPERNPEVQPYVLRGRGTDPGKAHLVAVRNPIIAADLEALEYRAAQVPTRVAPPRRVEGAKDDDPVELERTAVCRASIDGISGGRSALVGRIVHETARAGFCLSQIPMRMDERGRWRIWDCLHIESWQVEGWAINRDTGLSVGVFLGVPSTFGLANIQFLPWSDVLWMARRDRQRNYEGEAGTRSAWYLDEWIRTTMRDAMLGRQVRGSGHRQWTWDGDKGAQDIAALKTALAGLARGATDVIIPEGWLMQEVFGGTGELGDTSAMQYADAKLARLFGGTVEQMAAGTGGTNALGVTVGDRSGYWMAGRLQLVADALRQRFFGRIYERNAWATERPDGSSALPSLELHGAERTARKWITIAELLGKMPPEIAQAFLQTDLVARLSEAFEADMGLVANM